MTIDLVTSAMTVDTQITSILETVEMISFVEMKGHHDDTSVHVEIKSLAERILHLVKMTPHLVVMTLHLVELTSHATIGKDSTHSTSM